jgi:hemerythrin-like domain-containing protein
VLPEARLSEKPSRGIPACPRFKSVAIMAKTRIRTTHQQPAEAARGARPTAPAVAAEDCPIEMLYEEHFQQRQMASDMESLAETRRPRPNLARRILDNLDGPLRHHRVDEDESLFPRLRRRAAPEDEIAPLLDRLQDEHEQLRSMGASLMPALVCMADGALPAPEDRAGLRRFAQTERRHLIAENALVLPLARVRLTAADKAAALAEMRARRGRPLPEATATPDPTRRPE